MGPATAETSAATTKNGEKQIREMHRSLLIGGGEGRTIYIFNYEA